MVEEVRSGKPLQCGSGRRHPHEPPDLGGLRPRGRLLRSRKPYIIIFMEEPIRKLKVKRMNILSDN